MGHTEKWRIHLEQPNRMKVDLEFIDVELDPSENGSGIISGVGGEWADGSELIGNAVLTEDMVVGDPFYYAVPSKDFEVYKLRRAIERIEVLTPKKQSNE